MFDCKVGKWIKKQDLPCNRQDLELDGPGHPHQHPHQRQIKQPTTLRPIKMFGSHICIHAWIFRTKKITHHKTSYQETSAANSGYKPDLPLIKTQEIFRPLPIIIYIYCIQMIRWHNRVLILFFNWFLTHKGHSLLPEDMKEQHEQKLAHKIEKRMILEK